VNRIPESLCRPGAVPEYPNSRESQLARQQTGSDYICATSAAGAVLAIFQRTIVMLGRSNLEHGSGIFFGTRHCSRTAQGFGIRFTFSKQSLPLLAPSSTQEIEQIHKIRPDFVTFHSLAPLRGRVYVCAHPRLARKLPDLNWFFYNSDIPTTSRNGNSVFIGVVGTGHFRL